jgi:hypothetical protein
MDGSPQVVRFDATTYGTLMPQSGRRPQHQTRPWGDVGSMSGLPESGQGWGIYEYTP